MAWFLILLIPLLIPIYFFVPKNIKYFFMVFVIVLFPIIYMNLSLIKSCNNCETKEKTIVVLGAGIKNNKDPSPILQNRLDEAYKIFGNQKIAKIIVSGDNSKEYHNEPKVMKDYLIKKGIPENLIKEDFGGRRTMDSCYRIKNYFGVEEVIVVTQSFHIGRAVFLCNSVGLFTSYSIAKDSSIESAIWGYMREVPASWKALNDSIWFQPQVGSDGSENED
jgi:SanA protein